tara:strand:+ start:526 stop:1074 length:549 start_codon:yes stop_codon:yes gene_type:complete
MNINTATKKTILNTSNNVQDMFNYEINDKIEANLWDNLPFKNTHVLNHNTKILYIILFIMFIISNVLMLIVIEYYRRTMNKRKCDCSEVEKLKIMKYILISGITVWILSIITLMVNDLVIGPLVTIGIMLWFGYIIYGLIYFYYSTYNCKCSVSRIGSILGYVLLGAIVNIPLQLYVHKNYK